MWLTLTVVCKAYGVHGVLSFLYCKEVCVPSFNCCPCALELVWDLTSNTLDSVALCCEQQNMPNGIMRCPLTKWLYWVCVCVWILTKTFNKKSAGCKIHCKHPWWVWKYSRMIHEWCCCCFLVLSLYLCQTVLLFIYFYLLFFCF